MNRGWLFGTIPNLIAEFAKALGELLNATSLFMASRWSLNTCASRCSVANVKASRVESDEITNVPSIIKTIKMVVKIESERLVICFPLCISGTNRKMVRCDDCAIACLVFVMAGASIGSAI